MLMQSRARVPCVMGLGARKSSFLARKQVAICRLKKMLESFRIGFRSSFGVDLRFVKRGVQVAIRLNRVSLGRASNCFRAQLQ